MANVVRDAERIFSTNSIGPKNAARIWGFISKFVMLDRFAKTLFGKDFHPGIHVPRKFCSEDYLGTGSKVSIYFFSFRYSFLRQFSDTWRPNASFESVKEVPENMGRSPNNKNSIFRNTFHSLIHQWAGPCRCCVDNLKTTYRCSQSQKHPSYWSWVGDDSPGDGYFIRGA